VSNIYDVLVVGAGAAGCACATRLARGVRALLVDRGDPTRGRCCGGLIAHDAKAAIAALGVRLPEGVRVKPEPRSVHALDLESGIEQHYRRCYWNVDRARFDAWLLDMARERAEFRPGTQATAAARTATGFRVTLREGGRTSDVLCRFLVGADGASSGIRRALVPDVPAVPKMIALQVDLPSAPGLENQEVLFSSRLTDFYAWAIPKPDRTLVGAAFSDPHATRPRFDEVVRVFCAQHGIENRVLSRSSRLLSRPSRRKQLCPGGDGLLLCGEAAGLVSPSSGEGISFALASGMAAAAALTSAEPARAYTRPFAALARRVQTKFLKARIIFSPHLRRLALRLPWYP